MIAGGENMREQSYEIGARLREYRKAKKMRVQKIAA